VGAVVKFDPCDQTTPFLFPIINDFLKYITVVKFKRRTRYLEFFVQVVQKALAEGIAEQAMEWCEDTAQWINK
jgi:hypothetical protein